MRPALPRKNVLLFPAASVILLKRTPSREAPVSRVAGLPPPPLLKTLEYPGLSSYLIPVPLSSGLAPGGSQVMQLRFQHARLFLLWSLIFVTLTPFLAVLTQTFPFSWVSGRRLQLLSSGRTPLPHTSAWRFLRTDALL